MPLGVHAAWSRFESNEALEYLRSLPRDLPCVPFRADLIDLCRRGIGGASVYELLGFFEGDAEIRKTLERNLTRVLEGLRREPAPASYRDLETRARYLVQALTRVDVRAAVDSLSDAMAAQEAVPSPESSHGVRSWRLVEAAAAGLARSEAGREILDQRIADPASPLRVRIEAALSRAIDASAARRLLCKGLEGFDEALAERAVRVLGSLPQDGGEPWIDAGLGALVRSRSVDSSSVGSALAGVEALAARGRTSMLMDLLDVSGSSHEVFVALTEQVGRSGDARHASRLDRLYTREWEAERVERAMEVLLARARVAPLTPGQIARVFAGPREAARADLKRRFAGESLAVATSRWRTVLRVAEVLAARDELGSALAAQGAWWTWDARCLAALSRVAGNGSLASEIERAARIGFLGEASAPDRRAQLWRLEWTPPRTADGRIDLRAWSPGLDRLVLSSRRRVGRELFRYLGWEDPWEGRDPWAYLETLRRLVRARSALEAGDRGRARAALERARTPARRSRRAWEEWDEVRALIDDGR